MANARPSIEEVRDKLIHKQKSLVTSLRSTGVAQPEDQEEYKGAAAMSHQVSSNMDFEESKGGPGHLNADIKAKNIQEYQKLTQETEESKQKNKDVIDYIKANRELSSMDIVKSIGYDSYNIEYYLFFSQKYIAIQEDSRREQVKLHIKTVLKFISQRKRSWSLVFFNAVNANSNEAYQLIKDSYNNMHDNQKEQFCDLVVLYYTARWYSNIFPCKRSNRRGQPAPKNFEDLHSYLKEEKSTDVKFTQNILGSLPKENMQLYFNERNSDTEYQPNMFGQQETQQNAFSAMNLNTSSRSNILKNSSDSQREEKTYDIFGKLLTQFYQLPSDTNPTSPPMIFWLLAGFFRKNTHLLDTEGLFRVAAPEADVRELEIHMSQENFYYLTTIKNCHIVSNYWKKLMREMQDPICPYSQYDDYMELAQIAPERRVMKLKTLLANLPALNRNTLKFIIQFMREVVQHEPQNRMTSYNIAVTVGPNIFRPLTVRPADLINAGTYYDAVIRMMENYEILFEGAPIPGERDMDMLYQAQNLEFSNDMGPQMAKSQARIKQGAHIEKAPSQNQPNMAIQMGATQLQKSKSEQTAAAENPVPARNPMARSNRSSGGYMLDSVEMFNDLPMAQPSEQEKRVNRSNNRMSQAISLASLGQARQQEPETPDMSSILRQNER